MLEHLPNVVCSPFGAVAKGDADIADAARMIHDLSHPYNMSINDCTDSADCIPINYDGAKSLATRFLELRQQTQAQIKMLTGDVSGAFKHVPLHADHVQYFAGTIPELGVLVIDLCCPFGWTDSPALYWIAGSLITHLHAGAAPTWPAQPANAAECFDRKAWCDDHNCIEQDVGSRLGEAEISLRRAMVEVLGPRACNEEKFSSWFTRGKSLGLVWDLDSQTLSMPPGKIEKAKRRLTGMLSSQTTTRTALNKLLGSLRHVTTCVRAAAPFFQRLATLQRSVRRYHGVPVTDCARDDIRWFLSLLEHHALNSIPFLRFTQAQQPTVAIFMDASDMGLCALFPARREYLQVRFDTAELQLIAAANQSGATELGINLRELMSAVFAALVWGPLWSISGAAPENHVRFWIDNTSAVAWTNKQSSRNPFAQMLLRLLALQEVRHGFYSSAAHIPGIENTMADAGSRVWQSPSHADEFANLSFGWQQVPVPLHLRKLSTVWERCYEREL